MQAGKYSIDEISGMVAPIAREYGVKKIALFGSYARGEATDGSDVDFHLIDCGALRGLFRLAGFELALEERLKLPVDVLVGGSAFGDVLENAMREELVIYDA